MASTYGRETRFGARTVMPPAGGAHMRSDVTNWLDTPPGTSTVPGRSGPLTENGGLPESDLQAAPSERSASSSGPTGLERRLSSPVIQVCEEESAATPAAMRAVVPELPASMRAGPREWSMGEQTRTSPSASTEAPMARHASTLARVSAECSGPRTRPPPASAAANTARCV